MGSNKVIQHPSIIAVYCENSGCKTSDLNDPKYGQTNKVEGIVQGTLSDSS